MQRKSVWPVSYTHLEGPFPILTGQTIDLDTIQAIDYYRDNPLAVSYTHLQAGGREGNFPSSFFTPQPPLLWLRELWKSLRRYLPS